MKKTWSALWIISLVLLLAAGTAAARTTVVFWIDSDEITEFTERSIYELVNEYNSIQDEVFVDLMNVMASGSGGIGGANTYQIKINTALATGVGPDIWWVYDADMAIPIAEGYVDAAPDYVVENMRERGIYEWILDSMAMDGTVRGVPHDVMWGAMLYNKDIFREVGLDPDRGPETWDELVEYAVKLSQWDANGRLIRSGMNVRFTGGLVGIADKWAHFLLSAGGNILDETGTRVIFNEQPGIDALQLYVDLVNEHNVDAVDFPRDIQAFAQGYIAMMGPREAFMIPWIREYAPNIDLGTSFMPKNVRHASSGAIRMISVNANSQVKDEAWAFLDWYTQPEQAYRVYVGNEQISPYAPFADDPVFERDEFKAWTEHPNVIGRMQSVKLGQIYPILGRAIQSAVYQQQTVQEALDEAAAEVTRLLND